eukprot:327065_1
MTAHVKCNKRHVITPEKCMVYWDYENCPMPKRFEAQRIKQLLQTRIYELRGKEIPLEIICYLPLNNKTIHPTNKTLRDFELIGIKTSFVPSLKPESIDKQMICDIALDLYEWKGKHRNSIAIISADKDYSHLLSRIQKAPEIEKSFLITFNHKQRVNDNLIHSVDYVIRDLLTSNNKRTLDKLAFSKKKFEPPNKKRKMFHSNHNTNVEIVEETNTMRSCSNTTETFRIQIENDNMDIVDSDYSDNEINYNNNNIFGYLIGIDKNGNCISSNLLTKTTTTIGRAHNNDVILNNLTVSMKHVEIEINNINIDKPVAVIIDLESTNTTRVGKTLPSDMNRNEKIKANREVVVNSGDYITIGDCHFVFYHKCDYDSV